MTRRLAPVIDLEEAKAVRILRMEAGRDPELAAGSKCLDCDWRVALIAHGDDPGLAHLHAVAELCDAIAEAAEPREAALHMGRAAMAEIRRRVDR